MTDSDINAEYEEGAGGGAVKQLRLNSLSNTRKTYARILQDRWHKRTDPETYRDMIRGLSGYLAYFKEEQNTEIIERLKRLEEKAGIS